MNKENGNPSYVGEIPIFEFPQHTPQELRAHPEKDLFVVYDGACSWLCKWGENAFWSIHGKGEVVLNVQYWFRVPSIEEISRREEEDG